VIVFTTEQEALILEGFVRALQYKDAALLCRDLIDELEINLVVKQSLIKDLESNQKDFINSVKVLIISNEELRGENKKLRRKASRGNRKFFVGTGVGIALTTTVALLIKSSLNP